MPGEDGDQKRVSDPLDMELQVIMSCLMWALGTELGSSIKAESAFNSGIISPASRPLFCTVIAPRVSPLQGPAQFST